MRRTLRSIGLTASTVLLASSSFAQVMPRGGRTAGDSNGRDLCAGELAFRVGAIGHASLRS